MTLLSLVHDYVSREWNQVEVRQSYYSLIDKLTPKQDYFREPTLLIKGEPH